MKNHIVLIGGAGSLGSAIAEKYVTSGFKVIIGDIDETAANSLLDELSGDIGFIPVNVLEIKSILEFKNRLEKSEGSIVHLVSLAGNALQEELNGIAGSDMETIDVSVDLNLKSHIRLTKILLPLMEKSDSIDKTITFISSINAIKDYGLPSYSAAKAGLVGLVYSLSGELGKKNIRVNAVLPGTLSDPGKKAKPGKHNAYFDAYLKGSMLNRFATPQEIANVVFSLTEFMTCITGQCIVADCGQSVKSYMYP